MKLAFTLIAILLSTSQVFGQAKLRDVGIVGLMSHDIFAWDHKLEVNTENGRLDLSTIFDFDGGKRWHKGGNPKNAENSPVYSITMQLVDFYKKKIKNHSDVEARRQTVAYFIAMIKETYERLSGLSFPEIARLDSVNNTEQAALRGLHDVLPGRANLYDRLLIRSFDLTNVFFAKLRLNDKELDQDIPTFDGDYDQEYKEIKIPFTTVVLNLKKIDGEFIEKFSPYKQADILEELAKVGREEMKIYDTFFFHHITDMIEKATCPTGNQWLSNEVPCS